MFTTPNNRRRTEPTPKTGETAAVAAVYAPVMVKVFFSTVLTFLLVAGGVFSVRWALHSGFFAVTQIQFHGNSRATDLELQRLGSLFEGQNLLSVNVETVERDMLSHAWVKQVTLRRRWHSSVDVDIVEHQARAVIASGELYLVDEGGTPFKRLQSTDTVDLPLITGIDREEMSVERDVSLERVRRALSAIDAYAELQATKGEALSEVHLQDDDVSLVTSDGQEIRLGFDGFAAKLIRVKRVRRELVTRALAAEVILADNRVRPDWVTVQLATAHSEKSAKSGQVTHFAKANAGEKHDAK